MEDNYSKREMDEHFKDVRERFDKQDVFLQRLDKNVEGVNIKVGIQNGRVAKLESWRTGLIMAGAACVFLMGIIISLVVYSFQLSQNNLKNTILLELKS